MIIFLCLISDLVGQCALLVLWSLAQLTLPGFGPQSISLRTSLATGEDVNKNKINVELAHRYFSQNTILDFYLATWCLCGTPKMVKWQTWCSIKKLILAAEIYFWTSRIVPATFWKLLILSLTIMAGTLRYVKMRMICKKNKWVASLANW